MKNLKEYNYEELKKLIINCNPYHNYDFAEDIEEDIIYHIMECKDNNEIRGFFEQVFYYGCTNSATLMFIDKNETRDFYIKHIDSMEEFMLQYEDETGISMEISRDYPRYMQVCWLCYEELAKSISDKLFPEE